MKLLPSSPLGSFDRTSLASGRRLGAHSLSSHSVHIDPSAPHPLQLQVSRTKEKF